MVSLFANTTFQASGTTSMQVAPNATATPIFFDSVGRTHTWSVPGFPLPTIFIDGTIQYNGMVLGPFVGWYDKSKWDSDVASGTLPPMFTLSVTGQ